MKRLFLVLLTAVVAVASGSAQDDSIDSKSKQSMAAAGSSGFNDSDNTSGPFFRPQIAKFTILLGPDFQSGEAPFLDAFELSESVRQAMGEGVTPKDISVDLESSLPTKTTPSLRVRVPESTDDFKLEELRASYTSEAIRFGVSQVDVQRDATVEGPTFSVRVGYLAGRGVPEWSKYISIANIFSPDAPHIEVFNETAINDKRTVFGMEGMGSGSMGGMGMGMGSIEPQWAEPSGLVEGFGMLVSWSLKDKIIAVINTTNTTDWVRTRLDSDQMTNPILGSEVCVFLTLNTAYGFSTKANSWSMHEIEWNEGKMPLITISAQMATVKTSDDVLIFTHAGRWFSRNAATQTDAAASMEMGGSGHGELGMSMDMGYDGMGMEMESGMGEETMGVPLPRPTIAAAKAELERTRALQDQITQKVNTLVKQYHEADDGPTRQIIRESLTLVASTLAPAETMVQQAELRLLQARIDRLAAELNQHAQSKKDVTEAQIDQWLSEPARLISPEKGDDQDLGDKTQ